MKLKKLLFLLIGCLALSACGQQSFYGTYSFTLGNTKENAIGIEFILSSQVIDVPGPKTTSLLLSNSQSSSDLYGVKRKLDVNLYTGGNKLSNLADATDMVIKAIGPDVMDVIGLTRDDLFSILSSFSIDEDGGLYYSLDERLTKDKGHRMRIGIDSLAFFKDLPEEEREFYIALLSEISEALIEAIAVAFLNGNTLTVTIPVSLNDLLFQLCWYGLFINFNPTDLSTLALINLNDPSTFPEGLEEDIAFLPGADGAQLFEDRIGTVPDVSIKRGVDEVFEMNHNYQHLFEHFNYTFRAPHQVGLSLKKS